jgi:hypothetical protein
MELSSDVVSSTDERLEAQVYRKPSPNVAGERQKTVLDTPRPNSFAGGRAWPFLIGTIDPDAEETEISREKHAADEDRLAVTRYEIVRS